MRYAIISDIHGNAEALRTVLADIDRRGVDLIICLGDIVGYYPDPEECVELVKERAAYSVAGNHDYAAIGRLQTENFTFYAFEAMAWTQQNLSDSSRDYLASLPLSIELDSMLFTHSSPARPENFTYVFPNSDEAIREAFANMVFKKVFVGHTHWPCILMQESPGSILRNETDTVLLTETGYYLINPGSVGQPRNRQSSSSYALYDTETRTVSLIPVPYDFTATQKRTIEAGLPPFLAERLENGR